jgi:hypothetical protein
MTRKEAKAQGRTTYHGRVCKKHPEVEGLRYIHGVCVGCKREADGTYRVKNKDRVRAAVRSWAARNPEKVKQYIKKAKLNNKGLVNASIARRKHAQSKRTPVWLTADEFWMMEQAYALAALRTKMLGFSWQVDHILPLQGSLVSGLHVPYNLQVIPQADNVRKSNKFSVA